MPDTFKPVQTGWLSYEDVERGLDGAIGRVQHAIEEAKVYLSALIVRKLVDSYNATQSELTFEEWVVDDLEAIMWPWLGLDGPEYVVFQKKVGILFVSRSLFDEWYPVWPTKELAQLITEHLHALGRIPIEEGGPGKGLLKLEAYPVENPQGGHTGSIRIKTTEPALEQV